MWRSIRSKLVLVYLLLILFALQLIGAYFVRSLTASLIREDTTTAQNQAQLIATIAEQQMSGPQNGNDNFSILSSIPQVYSGVVYILNRDGVVVDTTSGPALVGQKRIDSVATQTLVGHSRAVAIHYDKSSEQHLLAMAVPIFSNQRDFLGVVESVVSIQNTYSTVRQVTAIFYTSSAVVLALTAVLGVLLSQTITRPILEVINQARHMASGDFTRRVDVQSHDEFGHLGTAINDLADKLDEALAENTRERERLRAVIKYMGDGVVALTSDLHVMFSNDAADRLLSEGERKLTNTLGLFPQYLDGKEHSYLKHRGDSVLHVTVTPIRKDDLVNGYVAIIRDVTEQEKLQAARRDFVANVSHELRTPLTSIKSYIEALIDRQVDDEATQEKFLRVIEQETDRMVRLTEDLLQLSGLEMAKSRFRTSVIDVRSWLGDAVERFKLQARYRDVDLSLACAATGEIRGDRDLLDRLLDNLISNALKYTADGGRVTVSGTLDKDVATVEVTDTGIGIPVDDLPHVFERFYRVDKARSRRMGGTGLGLALAREITERHDGTISLTSEVNHGTTVTVGLPLSEEDAV